MAAKGTKKGQGKGVWISSSVVAKVLVAVVIAGIGWVGGNNYQKWQDWINKRSVYFHSTSRYMHSDSQVVKDVAFMLLMGFEDREEMYRAFFDYFEKREREDRAKPPQAQVGPDGVSWMMADSFRPPQKKIPQNLALPPKDPKDVEVGSSISVEEKEIKEKTGWVFLGRYDKGMDCWNSQFFDFPDNQYPSKLIGMDVKSLVEEVKVWKTSPSAFGIKGKLLAILKQGSVIEVTEVKDWNDMGYYWAQVAYTVRKPKP